MKNSTVLMTVRFQNRTVIKDVHYGINECTSTVIMAYLEFQAKNSLTFQATPPHHVGLSKL